METDQRLRFHLAQRGNIPELVVHVVRRAAVDTDERILPGDVGGADRAFGRLVIGRQRFIAQLFELGTVEFNLPRGRVKPRLAVLPEESFFVLAVLEPC